MLKIMRGRINRATYWTGVGLLAVLVVVFNLIGRVHIPGELLVLTLTIPRLHDVGRSGWWTAPFVLLELAVVVVAILTLTPDEFLVAFGFFTIALLIALAWLGAVPGQASANRFGNPPQIGVHFIATAT